MVKSMTGYGRGESAQNGRSLVVEVRSVNNRYLDCAVKMPRAYLFAEDALKTRVQGAISRGKVDVFVTIEALAAENVTVTVNKPVADAYVAALEELCTAYDLPDTLSVSLISRFPDVLTVQKAPEDLDQMTADLLAALDMALDDFDAMRRREGAKLEEDVRSRAKSIEQMVAQVESRNPSIVTEHRRRLEAKLKEVLENRQLDESRILTEAAIFADKVAVDEETVRLRSHLAQLGQMFDQGGAVGRKLDFLIQEFNREANTIGSKCNDVETARVVVDIKAEIEKIREQIQNLE